jgi:hypothetical protein
MKTKITFVMGLFCLALLLAPKRNKLPSTHVMGTVTHETPGADEPRKKNSNAPILDLLVDIGKIESDTEGRADEIQRVTQNIADAALPNVLEWMNRDEANLDLKEALVRRWTQFDPGAAAAWAVNLPEGPNRRRLIEQIAMMWGSNDVAAAANWAQGLPEDQSGQAAVRDVAYEAARREPLIALELASPLPPTNERNDLLVHAISQWATADAPAAAAWADKVPDRHLRERLVGAVAAALADQDGRAAATMAFRELAPGEEQDRTAVAVVQRWAQSSPSDAASWVSRFPEAPAGMAAAENLVSIWAAQDIEGAGEWAEQLREGPLRETALLAYTRAVKDHDQLSTGVEFIGEGHMDEVAQ